MKLTYNEAFRKATEIQNAFNSCHEILYVGRSITNEELKTYICDMPWSCVFTSRTDPEFSGLFSNEKRVPRECIHKDNYFNSLNRKNMPVFRIFGIEGAEDDEQMDMMKAWGFTESEDREANLKFLDLLPNMLDCVNLLLVIGYDPSDPRELDLRTFASRMLRVINKSIMFFGMRPDVDERLKKIALDKQFSIYENTLSDIMDMLGEQQVVDFSENADERQFENVFFKNQTAITLTDSALQRSKHFATLLTEQELYKEQPQGKRKLQLAFSNFLKMSSTEKPQWCGYLKNRSFYLDRPFRKVVYYLTSSMLQGNNLKYSEGNKEPIILEGDAGSSKSIILAAVAHQIYEEHEYPVIYIKNENIMFYSGSEELEALNLLMSAVQKAGDKDSKVLLVWDCSSHRNVVDNVKNLKQLLDNLGRRFVLVCSSYTHGGGTDRKRCSLDSGEEYFYENGCYFVKSERMIDQKQKRELHQLFQEYSGIPSGRLNQWWNKLEEDANGDIFIYFYKLITLLQEPLRLGLTREQRIVGNYVQSKLDRVLKGYEKERIENSNNIFALAGIDPSTLELEMDGEEVEEQEIEVEEYNLERFNACIALLGQFKISTPYSLATKILTGHFENTTIYSANQREIFQLLTTQIPWIYYGRQSDDEDFKFSFRNTVEAEIFLQENNITADKQTDIICEIIQLYGMEYRDDDCLDQETKNCIQTLLRMIGPNTEYQEYAEFARRGEEHRDILRNLDRIIEELAKLRTVYGVPDKDGSFVNLEVTFMREYYGWKWDYIYRYDVNGFDGKERWDALPEFYTKELYERRLECLTEAIHLAVKKLEVVESELNKGEDVRDRRSMVERRNSLTNEMVLCNLAAEEIQSQYKECCWHNQLNVMDEWKQARFILPYRDIFKRMQTVIDSNPTNGYYYNTIMKVFKREYGRNNISEQLKMEYLSEINMIIDPLDSGETPNVFNRGPGNRDELGEHIAEIRQMAVGYTVTIHDLRERSERWDAFYRMYDQMQEINNPTAILFVCRQELKEGDILKERKKLTKEQQAVCARVVAFMQQEDNLRCIETKPMAMAMLIRVVWMESSGLPMSNLQEANLVSMPRSNWKKLMELCSQYEQRANGVEKPSIMLLYALSTLQSTGNYSQCADILSRIKEKDFYSNTRMRVPYIYCDEEGNPHLFTGQVIRTDGNRGIMRINGLPKHLAIKYDARNLGYFTNATIPAKDDVLGGLELGIGYTGFALYKEEGRKAKTGE